LDASGTLGSEPRLVDGPCTVLFVYFMITVLYFIACLLDDTGLLLYTLKSEFHENKRLQSHSWGCCFASSFAR